MDILITIFVNPLATELSGALSPPSIAFLLTNMANLVSLLSLVAVDTLIAIVCENVIKILKFLLANLALNTIFAQELILGRQIIAALNLATSLMKHIPTLHALNVLIADRLYA